MYLRSGAELRGGFTLEQEKNKGGGNPPPPFMKICFSLLENLAFLVIKT